jgi:hypothetical protein
MKGLKHDEYQQHLDNYFRKKLQDRPKRCANQVVVELQVNSKEKEPPITDTKIYTEVNVLGKESQEPVCVSVHFSGTVSALSERES